MKPLLKKYSYLLLLIPFFMYSFAARAQFNVTPLAKGAIHPEKEGFVYALPRNTVCVELTVDKTETFKGPFADFASKYLGLHNVNKADFSRYAIRKAEVNLLAGPDPDQVYFIEFDKKSKAEISLALTEDGIISGFSQVVQPKNADKNPENAVNGWTEPLFIDLLKPTVLEKVDTIIRRISVDTTTIEERVVRRSVSEKSTEQMAKETADAIRRIDENISNLISGYQEVNYSKESLEFMIAELRKLQDEYLSLFKGSHRTTTSSYTFYFTPREATNEGALESLCKFSAEKGIQPKNSPTGENVNLTITPENVNTSLHDFAMQRQAVSKKKHGLYYRIPQQTKITVTTGYNVLQERTEMISQLGYLTFLPAGNYSALKFNTLTGAIQKVSIK